MSDQVPGTPPEPTLGPMGETPAAVSQEERTMGMLCHLLGLALYIGIPFGNILGPLIVWLIKKDQYPFVNDQGKESLNFQISVTIYLIAASVLMLALVGFVLAPAVAIFAIVEVIMASVKASKGIPFRYPLSIKFIN